MHSKSISATFARLGFRIPAGRPQQQTSRLHVRAGMPTPLCVMKFGGTSVGDAACIERVAQIIEDGTHKGRIVAVVSAMSGVTNRLLDAAAQSEAGNSGAVAAIFQELRARHQEAADRLIAGSAARSALAQHMSGLFQEVESLCQKAILSKNLSLRTRDVIASLGERLAAPLVAATLAERGVASEAIDATEVIVTNANFGSADPCAAATRLRCETRLLPLVHGGVVPVVTGFIGATPEGLLTTLGRGGSDYSATILGAAIDATEVIIWTDVDGVLTADPRLVPDARTIPEISYREAAHLAHFGAKVLYPKTLRPLAGNYIPVWIRNTFSPQHLGTKITASDPLGEFEVTAVTAMSDLALITVGNLDTDSVPSLLRRVSAALAATEIEILMESQSPSQEVVRFVVRSDKAPRVAEVLQQEFATEFAHKFIQRIGPDLKVAMVTLVGQNLHVGSGLVGRTLGALERERLEVIAIAQGPTGCSISLAVAQENMTRALNVAHREFPPVTLDSLAIQSPECASSRTPASGCHGGQLATHKNNR
jgi:bifunctional aspartokinase / homoserine dehydrogenase 1